jgi:hypothetical protein
VDDATGEAVKASAKHPVIFGDPAVLATLCAALD